MIQGPAGWQQMHSTPKPVNSKPGPLILFQI